MSADRDRDHEVMLLVVASQQGSAPCFARLYKLTSSRLFAIVLRINRDWSESEEILQDVYLRLWNRSNQFDGAKGSAMAWLAAIAHNAAINSLRRRNCRPKSVNVDADDVYADCPSEWPQQIDTVAQAEVSHAVAASLAQLTSYQRACLTLAFFDGLSHGEISERLGKPLGTVKAWVRRSLIAMSPALAQHRDGAY